MAARLVVQPRGQGLRAVARRGICPAISPLAQQGLDEGLRLAIGAKHGRRLGGGGVFGHQPFVAMLHHFPPGLEPIIREPPRRQEHGRRAI